MPSEYSYAIVDGDLVHYGIPGMKWGHRRAKKLISKANTARQSSREWNEMARYAESKGKTNKAAKYRKYAIQDLNDARRYEQMVGGRKKNASKKSTKSKVNSGKKVAKKVMQKSARASIKSIGYASQFGARMLQNNIRQQQINRLFGD